MSAILKALYRRGPVLLLPVIVLWAGVSFAVVDGETPYLLGFIFVYGSMAAVVLWHIVLLVREPDKKRQALYALLHIPLFAYVAVHALVYAMKLPI